MRQIKLNLKKYNLFDARRLAIVFVLFVGLILLSYSVFHNPHQRLHEDIFATADKIRNFYRDEPGYWKLSTESAIQNSLFGSELADYKDEFAVTVGEGLNGDMGMPYDASFDIALKHLNKSSCINLSEFPVAKEQQLGLQKITIINKENTVEFLWGDEKNPLPIAKYATRNICQMSDNAIIWTFQ